MTSVNAGMLALHRRVQERTMPDTAVIVRPTTVSDGQGGVTETGTTTIATVACRLMPLGVQGQSRTEQLLAARIGSDFQWVITLPHGADVQTKDRLVIGARSFDVVGTTTPHSWDTAVRVGATEIL